MSLVVKNIRALDHVRLDVVDISAAARFYVEAIGLTEIVRYDSPNVVIVQLGFNGWPPGVELWYQGDLAPCPSRTEHIAFLVADVFKAVEHVASLGYDVDQYPRKQGPETVAFVRDPDGHLIEFNDFRSRPSADTTTSG